MPFASGQFRRYTCHHTCSLFKKRGVVCGSPCQKEPPPSSTGVGLGRVTVRDSRAAHLPTP